MKLVFYAFIFIFLCQSKYWWLDEYNVKAIKRKKTLFYFVALKWILLVLVKVFA